jgi:IS30 family transposase
MNKHHLTAEQRGSIEAFLSEGLRQSEIARKVGVDRSTISREVKQKSTCNGYKAAHAQQLSELQRSKCRQKKKMNSSARQKYITSKLQSGWSPEQISGRLRLEGRDELYVCPETIYTWLYTDPWAHEWEKFFQYLRYGREKRKRQWGRGRHRSKIPNRVSIHERPPVVAERIEWGHCEGDSVISPHKYAINTLNELTTGLVAFTKLRRKTAALTAQAMCTRLKGWQARTVTLDNGSEFTDHEDVTRETGVSVYFADPYSSWQRGANENVNMLLRGYLPKRQKIGNLRQSDLDDIAKELNRRPRKRHGFRTPIEVYHLLTQRKASVALDSRM